MAADNLPLDNEGWFRHHVIEALNELKRAQEVHSTSQERMHRDNLDKMEEIAKNMAEHETADATNFAAIRSDLIGLQLVKKIFYAAVAMILIAFMTTLISMAIGRQVTQTKSPEPTQHF